MNPDLHSTRYSYGNLIITGEYFVLTGARALAVPLLAGHHLDVKFAERTKNNINWITNVYGKEWFKATLKTENLEITSASDRDIAKRLQKILKVISQLTPDLFSEGRSYNISCNIEFNPGWGWGSSASLITNLAGWSGIDPFLLNNLVSSGSGYDIAASLASTPIFFSRVNGVPEIHPAIFNPSFKDSILFVYLGKKQNSESSIALNIESVRKNQYLIPAINVLTEKIAEEGDINEFMRCLSEHEKIISATLGQLRLKEELFQDFEGEIKSLGAWGGDFAMAVSPNGETFMRNYFTTKGLNPVFRFDDIIRTSRNN
ncbi:MAG: GHMP kinase [Bacteroidia bacterium]|nr:GHMP kinase [Bacteroidia bacterium]